MRYAIVLLLVLSLVGCKDKTKDAAAKDGTPKDGTGGADLPGKDKDHIRFRPKGGSNTVLGKARDRALDTEILNEMRQVKIALMTDYMDGGVPANKKAWLELLRDFRNLRALLDKDELVAFTAVRQNAPNTVLMYEKRVVEDNDGIVLLADGTPRRMNKADFDKLTKPAK
jgi:hypothetical protein